MDSVELADLLAKLAAVRDAGALTVEEYETKKAELLARQAPAPMPPLMPAGAPPPVMLNPAQQEREIEHQARELERQRQAAERAARVQSREEAAAERSVAWVGGPAAGSQPERTSGWTRRRLGVVGGVIVVALALIGANLGRTPSSSATNDATASLPNPVASTSPNVALPSPSAPLSAAETSLLAAMTTLYDFCTRNLPLGGDKVADVSCMATDEIFVEAAQYATSASAAHAFATEVKARKGTRCSAGAYLGKYLVGGKTTGQLGCNGAGTLGWTVPKLRLYLLATDGSLPGLYAWWQDHWAVDATSAVATTGEKAVPVPVAAEDTPAPPPAGVSIADIEAAIAQHKSDFPLSNFDSLKVKLLHGTEVIIEVKPEAMLSEGDIISFGSSDALDVSEAVFASGVFPEVALIHVQVDADFKDQFGKTATEAAGWLEISAATAGQFDYAGMQNQPSSATWCDADRYHVHPAIWKALSDGDKGCMTASTSP